MALEFTRLTLADLEEVHAVCADPETWRHLPSGRHTARSTTIAMIEQSERSWDAAGLGLWALREDGTFAGFAGAVLSSIGVWNLGYRLTPASWGRGLASAAAGAAFARAVELAPERPVTARVLTNNPASARVLERVGLVLRWENDCRRIYADRPLAEDLLGELIALG